MSYSTPESWWEGWHFLRNTQAQLAKEGKAEESAVIQSAMDAYQEMMALAGVLYAAPYGFPLYLTPYQRDNLTEMLQAVTVHPDTMIGSWNTGDWWGEVLYKVQGIGGDAARGNGHYEHPHPDAPIISERAPLAMLMEVARQIAHAQVYLLGHMDESTRSRDPRMEGVDLVRAMLQSALTLLEIACPQENKHGA